MFIDWLKNRKLNKIKINLLSHNKEALLDKTLYISKINIAKSILAHRKNYSINSTKYNLFTFTKLILTKW